MHAVAWTFIRKFVMSRDNRLNLPSGWSR